MLDVLARRRSWWVEQADALEALRRLPDGCVSVCATSPPYFNLRSYLPADHPDKALEMGNEPTLAAYVAGMVAVFAEVRRVLHPTGSLWLNVGDSYATNPGNGRGGEGVRRGSEMTGGAPHRSGRDRRGMAKPKDLLGVPWEVAFALRADGWWLRSDIIWAKTACMPESVTDRPTSNHEHVFLFAKSPRYFFDAAAVREPSAESTVERAAAGYLHGGVSSAPERKDAERFGKPFEANGRNLRNVWMLGPEPLADDHFAAWPTEIPRRAILAGSRVGDIVLDPFSGSGRTVLTALNLGRRAIGIELSGYQASKSRDRIVGDCPMFNQEASG